MDRIKRFWEDVEKKREEIREKHKGKSIVAMAIEREFEKNGLIGELEILENELKNWQKQGGKGEILHKIGGGFKTGKLLLEPIYEETSFIICEKGEEKKQIEEYSKRLKQEDPNKYVGFYMSQY